MEKLAYCVVHRTRPVEYVCSICDNFPLCEACKQEHVNDTRHTPENCKEVGLAIMHQRIKDAGGRQAEELAKGLTTLMKELEAGLLRELDKFQSSCVQTEEIQKMQKLVSDEKYAELYFYAKGLPASGAKSEAAIKELNGRLLKTIDTASSGFKGMLSKIVAAAQYKPVFAAYKKDEVLAIKGRSYNEEGNVISALKGTDMSRFKAAYIYPRDTIGDRTASELASCIQASHVSALYLNSYYISDAGAEVLARAALLNKSLSAFCIRGDHISDTGAKAMADAARNCRSLATFCLFGNSITDAGAKAVAEAVKDCPISTFCLGGYHINDVGAIAVAEAMKNCPLSVFSLMCSWVSDAGATAMAEKISSGRCSSTLSIFCLGGYNISELGIKKIASMIRGCPQLSSFYFDGKPLSEEMMEYILESMADVSAIRSVNIKVSGISKEQMDCFLNRQRQSGAGRQFKLRFKCCLDNDKIVCKKLAAEWSGVLAELRIVGSIYELFEDEVVLGVPE
ncbi:MAG: hypothetical protein P4L50_19935 [Anaerolineaceae bacterium]|nr:hypothetical protein [Anaerolineaceae bacterium]